MQNRIKLRPDRYERFHDTLAIRGYRSYDEFLASDAWRDFNDWYRSSSLPQACLVCGCDEFQLHHWHYEHIGFDDPCDVIPLCREHHLAVHRWMVKTGCELRQVVRQLVECFGFSSDDARQAFRPFKSMFRQASRRTRRCNKCQRPIGKGFNHDDCNACYKSTWQPVPRVLCPGCGKMRRELNSDGKCMVCRRRAEKAARKQIQPVKVGCHRPRFVI